MGVMAELTVPPERVQVGELVVRRLTAFDAPDLARALQASLDHLRPWMPWATSETATSEAQRARLEGPSGDWAPDGSEYAYGMFLAGDGRLVGGIGLHRRADPEALEIGYWVHAAHTGRGFATTAAGALTDAGFALRGVERIEIHCDAANRASAAVPAKLGYRLVRVENVEPEVPVATGHLQIWALAREEWLAAAAATDGRRSAARAWPSGPR